MPPANAPLSTILGLNSGFVPRFSVQKAAFQG